MQQALEHYVPEGTRSALYLTLATMVIPLFFAFRWYLLDATERQFKRNRVLDILVVSAALFAIPYYLFRSRGWRGGLRSTALFLFSIAALAALDYGARYAVYLIQVSTEVS